MRSDAGVENWIAGLNQEDRLVICPIVRGEILFGVSRLPLGRRRTELEQTAGRFLALFHCEPVPPQAADFYAPVKLACLRAGVALDENDLWIAATALALGATLVSWDSGFAGVENLPLVAPGD